ncbi:retron St85 family RNA-directed DNA polymerase [Aeromonas media]|uniref:retron St85 family RNA-directed DNA polymerase n=2 Tax=Aeromonas media TaxID=651 RepID=UPI0015DCE6FA|nr:retron St85 family RNA-directed DNA polymerase [Aeromonas media]BBS86654.1 RNA-directed DNA polymerase [Aeromonas media]
MSIVDYVCDALCIEKMQLMHFAVTAPHRYKKYEIPKRSGNGTRTIAQPSKQLKFIQRIIISELEKILTPHPSAFAYIKGISIKDNAEMHVKNRYLLKMDFKDFFPSITPDLMFQEYARFGVTFSPEDSALLSNILFFKLRKNSKLKLSIGAPSSPFISNIIMRHFDAVISELCQHKKISYTRYADDITFSSNIKNVLFEIPEAITVALKKEGYKCIKINKEKTVFSSKRNNRHVTGITISNEDKLSVGRTKKRILTAAVHKFSLGYLSESDIEKLKGELSFVFFVEPAFKDRLIKKYGYDVCHKLWKHA